MKTQVRGLQDLAEIVGQRLGAGVAVRLEQARRAAAA